MESSNGFEEFEKRIGVRFVNKSLLRIALTHRSYINENKGAAREHNERMEFLGDAVLELVITEYLYGKYPLKPEGELTSYRAALVRTETLAEVAGKLKINEFLLLSRGEAKDTGRARQFILANTVEAIIGAIYLDGGYDVAKKFISNQLFKIADEIVVKGAWLDAKSRFQEKAQDAVGITPSYKVISEVGPDHDKKFVSAVFLGKDKVAEGEGLSKQEAEQEAARAGLLAKKWG
ncbi:MAG: ribonuclease III [bacterium]|nr:ribonuclease III [bacterium]